MIGGRTCRIENGVIYDEEPCPTTGEQISRYLKKNPQYALIDTIDVTEPRVINDHSVKAFFQCKEDYNIKEAARDLLESLQELIESVRCLEIVSLLTVDEKLEDELLKANNAIKKALK